jgi:hypothetical protein
MRVSTQRSTDLRVSSLRDLQRENSKRSTARNGPVKGRHSLIFQRLLKILYTYCDDMTITQDLRHGKQTETAAMFELSPLPVRITLRPISASLSSHRATSARYICESVITRLAHVFSWFQRSGARPRTSPAPVAADEEKRLFIFLFALTLISTGGYTGRLR